MNRNIFKTNKGISLFIAVVLMSILLFVSFAVVNITIKGTLFATSGRDSQFAFYAAEAGIECAIYWDTNYVVGTQDGNPIYGSAFSTSTAGSVTCAGQTVDNGTNQQTVPTNPSQSSRIGGGGSAAPTSIFMFNLNQGNNPVPYCAIVTVTKNDNGSTYLKSRGYNTCDTSNLRRIERGIEVTY